MSARTALIVAVSLCVLQILDARCYRQEALDVSQLELSGKTVEAKVQQSTENCSMLPTTDNGPVCDINNKLDSFVNNSVNKRSASNSSDGSPDDKESTTNKEDTGGNGHEETYHSSKEDGALNTTQQGKNRGNKEMVQDAIHEGLAHSLFSSSEHGKTSSYEEGRSLAKTGQTSYHSKPDTSYDPAEGSKNISGDANTPIPSEEHKTISSDRNPDKNYSSESLITLKNNTTSFSGDTSMREVNNNETTTESIITAAPKRSTGSAIADYNVTVTSKHHIVSHDQMNDAKSQEALKSMLTHNPKNNVTNDTVLNEYNVPSTEVTVGKTAVGKSNEKKLLSAANDLDYSGKYSFSTNKNNSKESSHKNVEKDNIPPYDNDASIFDSDEYDTENETQTNKESSVENSNGKGVVFEDDKFSLKKYPSSEKKIKLKDYSEENSEEKNSSGVSDNYGHKANYSDSGKKTKLKKDSLVQGNDEENLSSEIDDESDFNTMHPGKLKNVSSEKPISVDNSDRESEIPDDFSLDAEYPGSKNKIKLTKDESLENDAEEDLVSEGSNDSGMDTSFPDKVKKVNSEKLSSVKSHAKTGEIEHSSLETEYSESKNKTKFNKDSTVEDNDKENLSLGINDDSELDTNHPSKENKVSSKKQSLVDSIDEEPEVTDASNSSDEYYDSEKIKLTKDHSVENEDDEDLAEEGNGASGVHTNYSHTGVEVNEKKGSSAGNNIGKHPISKVADNSGLNADSSEPEKEVNLEKEDSTQANDEDSPSSEVNDSGFENTYSNSGRNMSLESQTSGEGYNEENEAGKLNRSLSAGMQSNEDSESNYGAEDTSTASNGPSNHLNSGSEDDNRVHTSGHEHKFLPKNYNTANPRKPTFSNQISTIDSTKPVNTINKPHFGHVGSKFPSNSLGRPNMFQQMPFMNQFQMFPMGNAPYFDNSLQMTNLRTQFNMYNPRGFGRRLSKRSYHGTLNNK